MRCPGRLLAIFATTLWLAAPALAQTAPTTSVGLKLPQWDAGGSFGLAWVASHDLGEPEENGFENTTEYRVDLGRYWNPHLKTEIGFSTTPQWQSFGTPQFAVAGLPAGAFAWTERRLRLHVISPAVTYQFFENAFVHPYVTGGMRVGLLQEHRVRQPTTSRVGGVTYQVSALDEHILTAMARPFVAGGFKSYINDRTFVRSEGLVSFWQNGESSVTIRLGIGVDF